MKQLDYYLNRITLYRLVLYGLLFIVFVAVLFGFTGTLQLGGGRLAIGALTLLVACIAANYGFSKLFGAATNVESAPVTALILFCLFLPPKDATGVAMLAATGVLAMASKYIVAYKARHIFNPAAFAAVAVGLLGLAHGAWWIANDVMLPFVAIVGLLILRKSRRFLLFLSFLVPAALLTILFGLGDGRTTATLITDTFMSWPLLFLGTIMLTEPLTSPTTTRSRMVYGVFVGMLVGIGGRLHVGSVHLTPEMALVLGNLYAYTTVLRQRLRLKLISRQELGPGIVGFRFASNQPFRFKPGQYMDVTLPLARLDSRGNRRSFSIASSPGEGDVLFGIRIMQPSSAFKTALSQLKPGHSVYGVQVAGDFLLPAKQSVKMAWIAGGIGITPFRSMLQHIIDTNQQRDIVLFYQVSDPDQAVFKDVLDQAANHGVQVVYVLAGSSKQPPKNWHGEAGFITSEMLAKYVPDAATRRFYISGPPAMVDSYRSMLNSNGIRRSRIITDHFSGY
ncbi:MAG TPA: hypothetical protein VLF43_05010 [Candidatus Saccharimonadales bacterium]|nr:hypothetical protein [Candidatus Saccharimonadales bacterium]